MIELLPAVNTAIELVGRLSESGNKLKHSEFMSLIADLTLELANLKIGMAAMLEENDELKRKLRAIDNSDFDPCPRCKQPTFRLEESKPDPTFGEIGGRVHSFRCSNCDYTDQKFDGLH